MRARAPLGLSKSWLRWALALALACALAWLGTLVAGPAAPWVALGAAVLAAAVTAGTWRGLPLTTVARRRFGSRAEASLLATAPAVEVAPLWDPSPVAVRGAGDQVVAVVAVDGPDNPPAVFDRNRVESSTSVPVAVVAAALRQFDVRLAGIDILSVGRRRASRGHHPYAATYTAMIGDHPAVGMRRTWCVLRMDRLDNAAAIACRDSVAATVAACAARLAAELTARKVPARVLGAAELAQVDAALAAGIGEDPRPGWGAVRHGAGAVSAFWVSPADISTETLDRLWVPDTDATAVCVQLRPAEGRGAEIGVIVRYATPTPAPAPPLDGLNPLSGRHGAAVRAGLADAATPPLRVPHRRLADGEDLRVPLGSTGILLGTLGSGHPLLMDLAAAAPGAPATVSVAGEPALLVQLGLRSAAIGYQVLVVTADPARWRDAVAAGLQLVAPGQRLPEDGPPVMLIYDTPGLAAGFAGPAPAITVRAVRPAGASVADVHIEQESPDTAAVRTAGLSTRIAVDVNPERNLIKQGRGA